jgi:putative ABC transport system ATP-binding protein
VRCLVKRPDLLVIDGALAPFGEGQRRELVSLLLERSTESALFMVLPNERETEGFDALVRFKGGEAELLQLKPAAEPPASVQEEFEAVGPAGKRVAGGVA